MANRVSKKRVAILTKMANLVKNCQRVEQNLATLQEALLVLNGNSNNNMYLLTKRLSLTIMYVPENSHTCSILDITHLLNLRGNMYQIHVPLNQTHDYKQ